MGSRKSNYPCIHVLKTEPVYFEAVDKGIKRFEIRKNDRDFRLNDFVLLWEYTGVNEPLTRVTRVILVQVDYVIKGHEKRRALPRFNRYGIGDGYCVFGWQNAIFTARSLSEAPFSPIVISELIRLQSDDGSVDACILKQKVICDLLENNCHANWRRVLA